MECAKQGECQFPKEMDVGARTNLLYVRNVSDLQARGIHSKCESLQVQVCTGSCSFQGRVSALKAFQGCEHSGRRRIDAEGSNCHGRIQDSGFVIELQKKCRNG